MFFKRNIITLNSHNPTVTRLPKLLLYKDKTLPRKMQRNKPYQITINCFLISAPLFCNFNNGTLN